MNPTLTLKKERNYFIKEERSIHKEIPPAKCRISDYRRKNFGKLRNKTEERPMTSYTQSSGQADITTQAQSVFEEEERAVSSHPFRSFFTSGDPVVFKTQNRFEGKSNYLKYYPTNDIEEQKIEKIWIESKNK